MNKTNMKVVNAYIYIQSLYKILNIYNMQISDT